MEKIEKLRRVGLMQDLESLVNGRNNSYNREEIKNPGVIKENGSLFAHEQTAIEQIGMLINRRKLGKLVSNILLFDRQSNNFLEYDLIVVTDTGIFVVELKHWSGNIKVDNSKDPYNWIIDGTRYRRNPHRLNVFKCKVLKGIYQHQFRSFPNIRVESVVVLTHPEVTVEGASNPRLFAERGIYNPTFSSINDFITYLTWHSETQKKIIDNYQIDSIVNFLNKLNQPKSSLNYKVPGFETIEYLRQSSNLIELVARPLVGSSRRLNRFRIFRPPYQAPKEEIERFKKIASNTFNAVSLLSDHPNIGKVWLVPNDEGYIIEGSDWSEAGTLRDLINGCKQDNNFSVKDRYEICQGILDGLHRAHEENVIHRALKPENILIMNGIPKIINFDLSYQYQDIEAEHLTVIPDPSKLKDDGYTAPEVLEGKDIDETTDYYSFGIITYELLTGDKPFANSIEMRAKGGKLTKEHIKQLLELGTPEQLVSVLEQMIVFDRNSRIKSIQKIADAFNHKSAPEVKPMLNAKLPTEAEYDVYRIIQLIGEGAETQIYKAYGYNNKLVALKMFNREVSRERITREYEILKAINSSYVVKTGGIRHWNNDRYFIEMDYIDGEPLRAWIEKERRPDWTTFKTITQCLFEAVRALHNHRDEEDNPEPILHSDIKPDNILITKDLKAVLIDCGIAGSPRSDIFQGTIGYVPPDCIVGAEMEYTQDGDLFALGVTLWEWIFGEKPYKNPAIGDESCAPQLMLDKDFPPYIIKWLTKAVATSKENRFKNIEEMESAFQGQIIELKNIESQDKNDSVVILSQDKQDLNRMESYRTEGRIKNEFVNYLNSLSNASAGNENAIAEFQIGNEHFEKIHVHNPLTDFVFRELVENKRNVILTGNAGDGKTTIAAEICQKITGNRLESLPLRKELNEGRIVIIKDMSELNKEEQVKILEEAIHNNEKTYLIISNTGALLESGSKVNINGLESEFIRSQLLAKMESEQPETVFNDRVILINIGRTDSINTACLILKKMINCQDWAYCENCIENCPIRINVQLIKENEEIVLERVELLYRRLYEYGIRLTLRQMTGHLAYAITSGQTCREIQSLADVALREKLPSWLFTNRFFGDDGRKIQSEALQLDPVHQIHKISFGAELEPAFERRIWVKKESPLPIKGQVAPKVFSDMINRLDEYGVFGRTQIRRLVYFVGVAEGEKANKFISIFLRSPLLQDFLEICRSGKPNIHIKYKNEFRTKTLQVLQEYFVGMRLPDSSNWGGMLYVTLNRRGCGSRTQMVIADFFINEFTLELRTTTSFRGEEIGKIYLVYGKDEGKVEMELDLPFLDYVIKRHRGNVTEELSPYYTDRLEKFKVELMNWYTKNRNSHEKQLRLLKICADRSFHMINLELTDDGKMVVLG